MVSITSEHYRCKGASIVLYTFSERSERAKVGSYLNLTPMGAIYANTIRQAIHSIGLKRGSHTDEDIIEFCEGYASEKGKDAYG